MSKKVFLSLILIFIAILACNIDQTPHTPALDPDTGKSYFFLEEGKWREYEVFEIRYFGIDISDTFRYEIREEIKEAFINGVGDTSHLVHRFRRDEESQPWELDSVWSARVELDRAVSVENNRPIIKMTFPVVVGNTWDGNLFNSSALDTFEIRTFNQFFQVPGRLFSFQEAMIVQLNQEEDPITDKDFRREVYVDSIGLVFKEYEVVEYCSDADICTIGDQTIISGRLYREILTAHGFAEEGG